MVNHRNVHETRLPDRGGHQTIQIIFALGKEMGAVSPETLTWNSKPHFSRVPCMIEGQSKM